MTRTATLARTTDSLPAGLAPAGSGPVQAAVADKGQVHLAYVDGLRGLCALYIVLHHLAPTLGYAHAWFDWVIAWGGYCVAVFITISGFCLMLPVTRAGTTLRGGALRFYRRRMRRILPPYYAALLLSFLAYPLLFQPYHSFRELLLWPQLHSLLLHAVLLHNWSNATKYTFNGPLWSIAVECQIYVLFPLLVLLWRRLGAARAVACIGVFSVGASILLHYHGNVHFLLLFALGMWAAECAGDPQKLRHSATLIAMCLVVAVVGTLRWPLLGDVGVGGMAALLLAREATESRSVLRRVLTWRPLRMLGLFSFSIYLLHELGLTYLGLHQQMLAPLPMGARYFVVALAFVPALLLVSYLFYLAFERPFLSRHAKIAIVQDKLGAAAC